MMDDKDLAEIMYTDYCEALGRVELVYLDVELLTIDRNDGHDL